MSLPPLWQGRRRSRVALLIGLALAQALSVLAAALAARALLERVPPFDTLALPLALLPLALAFAVSAVLRQQQTIVAERLAQGYVARVRLALFDALATLSPTQRHKRSRGSVMLRFVGDAQALRRWVGDGLPSLVVAALAWPTLLLTLTLLDGRWALLAAGWGGVAALGMALTLPPLTAAVRQARWCQAVVAAKVHDQIATLPALQAASRELRERRLLARRNQRLAAAMTRQAAAMAWHRLVSDGALGGLALSVVALWLHDRGASAAFAAGGGTLLGALGLIAIVAAPLRRAGLALAHWAVARVARERLNEFLGDAERRPRRQRALPVRDDITEAGVEIYIDGWPLRGTGPWSSRIAPGRRVALFGPSGCGKTALLEALAGIRPDPGPHLRCAGVALAALRPDAHAALIGFVSPALAPGRGTVASNLRERCPDADRATLAAACATAGWPRPSSEEELLAPVRDDGANLSGTERRSLLLARALVGAPALLLIDDLEQALPGPARVALERLLRQHRGSLVYATHEPALAALADEVWDLGTGQIRHPQATATPALARVA
jgi:ABC-type multidrug transport system fused ATPase/permease subunit